MQISPKNICLCHRQSSLAEQTHTMFHNKYCFQLVTASAATILRVSSLVPKLSPRSVVVSAPTIANPWSGKINYISYIFQLSKNRLCNNTLLFLYYWVYLPNALSVLLKAQIACIRAWTNFLSHYCSHRWQHHTGSCHHRRSGAVVCLVVIMMIRQRRKNFFIVFAAATWPPRHLGEIKCYSFFLCCCCCFIEKKWVAGESFDDFGS